MHIDTDEGNAAELGRASEGALQHVDVDEDAQDEDVYRVIGTGRPV